MTEVWTNDDDDDDVAIKRSFVSKSETTTETCSNREKAEKEIETFVQLVASEGGEDVDWDSDDDDDDDDDDEAAAIRTQDRPIATLSKRMKRRQDNGFFKWRNLLS